MISLYSPELDSDNPIIITPRLDAGDSNPMSASSDDDGGVLRNFPRPNTSDLSSDNPRKTPDPVIKKTINTTGLGGKVTQIATEQYDIAWPIEKLASFYRVFASMSPLGKDNKVADNLEEPSYVFNLPYVSETVEYYFWVAWVGADGKQHLLSEDPATLRACIAKEQFNQNPITAVADFYPDKETLNLEQKKVIEFARNADRLMLENDGEPAILYMRRYAEDKPFGSPCTCTDKLSVSGNDPDYLGRGRCGLCYGTGVYGGYYPGIAIRFRYSSMPSKEWRWTKRGQEFIHNLNSYTLWAPVVRKDDLLVRVLTGERFIVDKNIRQSTIRGVLIHQEFDLKGVERQDILFQVTDESIRNNLEKARLPGFFKKGYSVFSNF